MQRFRGRNPEEIRAKQEEEDARERSRLLDASMARLHDQLGRRYSREAVALDRFRVYHTAQQAAVAQLKALQTDTDSLIAMLKDGRGLVFYGTVGTGKDHLMASMLYALLAGCFSRAGARAFSVCWISGQELFGRFRDTMDNRRGGESEGHIMSELAGHSVLAISDPIPPAGSPTDWNLGILYRLFDRRYRSMRPTWATLNALSLEDADAKLSAPVFDRLRENAKLFPCFWPSYRERTNAQEKRP